MKTLFAIFGSLAFVFQSIAQTNGSGVVVTTNYVTAVNWFREVNGQLYNTKASMLWREFDGKVLKVETNGIVVSILTPVYGRMDESPGWIEHGELMGLNPSQRVLLRYDESGKVIFLKNYPSNLEPAVTQVISFRAMRVGTINDSGNTLELWDYGTPHRVAVVSTNYVKKADSKAAEGKK
ncbi:MAG TPA: hypothetical protein VFB55_08440 [Verrucomicrobiae bacterium]|nr:hypothetical protein [Verrucomicrobiae bacterium]